MKTFKQYFTEQRILEENRRTFLKTLFGTAATAAVSNPAAVASAIAKKAGSPWLKMTLEGDFAFYDHAMVGPEAIGALTKGGGKYVPGISDSGDVIIDFDDSAVDLMQVYVKPGTDLHNKLKAGLESDEGFFDPDDRSTWGDAASTFEQEVFKTITGSDSSTQWHEDQIESQTERGVESYEARPDHQKDDWDDVDEDGYQSQATMDATDQVHRYLDASSEDFAVEIPEEIKAVIERGYMKSYARGAGTGNEAVTTDSLEKLRELTNDPDLEDPDEDDVYRWLEGEADGVWDTYNDGRADWKDDYQRDMDQVTGPEDNKIEDWVTAGFNMMLGADKAQKQMPIKKLLNVPGFWSVMKDELPDDVNMNEPIQIAHDGREPIKILSGFDQLTKAYHSEEPVYVKMVQTEGEPEENEHV